jgi:hypothetical protein
VDAARYGTAGVGVLDRDVHPVSTLLDHLHLEPVGPDRTVEVEVAPPEPAELIRSVADDHLGGWHRRHVHVGVRAVGVDALSPCLQRIAQVFVEVLRRQRERVGGGPAIDLDRGEEQ